MNFNIPNQLTILRIVLTPLFVYLMLQQDATSVLSASIIFFIASFTDWYDGYFARRYNLTSRWGQFMDPLADKILVSSALIVFALLDYVYWWMIILVISRDFLITFLRSFALAIAKPILTSTFAKWKTFIQMGFVFVLIIYMNFPALPEVRLIKVANPYIQWTTITFSIVVILTVISGVHYLIVNRSHLSELGRRTANLFKRKKS